MTNHSSTHQQLPARVAALERELVQTRQEQAALAEAGATVAG